MTGIGVIGAGAWGTALAQVYAEAGKPVTLWAREAEIVESVNTRHENGLFLKDIPLNKDIKATANLAAAAKNDVLLIVTPAQHVRAMLTSIREHVRKQPVILC